VKFFAHRADTVSTRVGLDRWRVIERGEFTRFFDNERAFVLDIKEISPIIYIWYEGGWLSPPVVTAVLAVRG
jgi:hypothetical protein